MNLMARCTPVARLSVLQDNSSFGSKFIGGKRMKSESSVVKPAFNTKMSTRVSAIASTTPVYSDGENGMFVDTEAMYAASSFPIKPEDLITRTKEWLIRNHVINGFNSADFSDDFKFVAPVVGPLAKDDFIKAVAGFDLKVGIPDLNPQYYDFRVDPFEPNRVWYTSRTVGTHTGVLAGAIQPTGTVIESPPQTLSATYNEEGLIKKITVGYVMDREIGNTGGMGAVFGILYAVGAGLPFPEAQPFKPSFRYKLFQTLGKARAFFDK